MTSDKRDWLVGKWVLEDEYSRIAIEISKFSQGLRVRAYDQYDGEESEVSKVKWQNGVLSFETFVPSNKWRTIHRLTPISRTEAVQQLTIWEHWNRKGLPKSGAVATAKKGGKARDKRFWLVGKWARPDPAWGVMFEIGRTARGLKVRSFDKHDGEESVVSKARWHHGVLSFELYWLSMRCRTKNRLTPISRTKSLQEFTFWETWTKLTSTKPSMTR